jgi:hypothetical protein
VSTMWFVFLSFVLFLIPLAIVGGIVFGMYKLLGALPPIFQKGQAGMVKVAGEADKISKSIAVPFIAASSLVSQVKGMLRSLSQIYRS